MKISKTLISLCALALLLLCSCVPDQKEFSKDANVSGSSIVKSVHPRLFINKEDVTTIKNNAASGDGKVLYDQMKARVDELMSAGISFPDPLAKSGEYNKNHEVGFRASDAALIWLVSGDDTYLEHTKTILRKLIEYYQLRVKNNLNIAWYVYSQICTLCAYDWIYNDLSAAEREEIGNALYKVMYDIAWHGNGIRPGRYRENKSDYDTGCYGVNVLPWYLAITFYGDGVNDVKCGEMFNSGYAFYQKMASYRREMAGEKGGGATGCVGYSFGYYPIADFSVIHCYRAATGIDISEDFDYVIKYLDYLDWVRLPGNKEFGFGDASHWQCNLPHTDINYHISEIANIYGKKHPEVLPLASRMLTQYTTKLQVDRFPFMRLLHKVKATAGNGTAVSTATKSMYFETMGQMYMRSGLGDNDTYAMFVCGGKQENHKHYDNNHFVIYKNGYRAVDSGTRPEPGQHLSHYYARTVAHNCVTVRMPNETFPKYWGELAAGEVSLPVPNDGGQNNQLASVLRSYKETGDYVYLASDATKAYNSSKASLMIREFVYVFPDLFIVCDRARATNADYPKTWLYHTVDEPQIDGLTFTETSQGGRTICRTLYPADAVIEKIGGPGKQFWSDGKNWPLPAELPSNCPPETWPLLGQWRVEVKPGAARKEDIFLHMLQVGDNNLKALPETTLNDTDDALSMSFVYEGKNCTLSFNKKSNYGCSIDVKK